MPGQTLASFSPHLHPKEVIPHHSALPSSPSRGRRRKLVINYKRRGLGSRAAPQCHPWPDAIYTVSWLRGQSLGTARCSHVPLHVEGEVVGAGESPLTEVALEGPVPCVLAVVAGQLIRAGKFPATAFPGAVVGLLACRGEGMSVGLEVPFLPVSSPLCFPAQHHPF